MAEFDAELDRNAAQLPELSAIQREADEADLYAGPSRTAGVVGGAQGMIDLLRNVAEFAAKALPGADGASVALIDPQQGISSVQTWAATQLIVYDIDTVQFDEPNEGPCITCMQSRRPAVTGSLGTDNRWPNFARRVAEMRMNSALSLPLIVGDLVIGSINAYAKRRDAFGVRALRLGSQFARPAAVAVHHAQLLASARQRTLRLQRALDSRSMIDQAIGILRSRSGGTADEALERLTEISYTDDLTLHTVAERLVEEATQRARARRD